MYIFSNRLNKRKVLYILTGFLNNDVESFNYLIGYTSGCITRIHGGLEILDEVYDHIEDEEKKSFADFLEENNLNLDSEEYKTIKKYLELNEYDKKLIGKFINSI